MPAPAFWVLAGAVLGAAAVAVSAGPSPLRSALSLAGAQLGLAALHILLGAPLLGVAQLAAAAGSGLAVFLLEASEPPARGPVEAGYRPLAKLASAALVLGLVAGGAAVLGRLQPPVGPAGSAGAGIPGASLLADHLLAVYVAAVLLPVAVVAALVLGQRRLD